MERDMMTRVSQNRETRVQVARHRNFLFRYVYARAAETRNTDDLGQDYLVWHQSDDCFCFALCDGVGQSFYGDIGARLLGDGLVTWLVSISAPMIEEQAIRLLLAEHLRTLTRTATRIVQEYRLPDDVQGVVRDVLEQKRTSGSDSTFIAGRIDRPCTHVPEGRLLLAWMGDSRLRIWGPDRERTSEFGNTFHTGERWSSYRGPIGGDPHVFVRPLTAQSRPSYIRLAAYSDGLAILDGRELPDRNADLQQAVDLTARMSTSDDVAFLEVFFGSTTTDHNSLDSAVKRPHVLE